MYYSERISGFQIADPTYWGAPPKDAPLMYDIIKWVPYEKPQSIWDIQQNKMIEVSEYCYVVGRLVWNNHEKDFDFESVGLRWIEDNPPEEVVKKVLEFALQKGIELRG